MDFSSKFEKLYIRYRFFGIYNIGEISDTSFGDFATQKINYKIF